MVDDEKILPKTRTSANSFEKLTVTEVGVTPPAKCIDEEGIDLSGGWVTDSLGRFEWRLSNLLCKDSTHPNLIKKLDFPVSFVATPNTDKPAYITAKFKAIQTGPLDLIIEVYSWDSHGAPAPDLPFYWRCRIPFLRT